MAEVHADRPEVDAEQQDGRRERKVDDSLNRDDRGEVVDRISDIVGRHLTLERLKGLVDLAVEADEVSLGPREVVRVDKPVPSDSNLSINVVPAVRDAELLFIPGNIPDLDKRCQGRIERHPDRPSARGRGPEEASDRDVEARDRCVSRGVVRTGQERGSAADGDVHLRCKILAQRDRASWKRQVPSGNGESVEKRGKAVRLDAGDCSVGRASDFGGRFHFAELGAAPHRDAVDAGDRLDGFAHLGSVRRPRLELDVRWVIRENPIQRRPRGRIDRDEGSCNERDRQEDAQDGGQGPSPTAKDVCRSVAKQGHGIPPASLR